MVNSDRRNINILELSTELAHARMIDELRINNGEEIIDDEEILIYTEEAQDSFNRWYDYYFDIINNNSVL